MERVRTFRRDGLIITNCIWRRNTVEVCYLFNYSRAVHNEDELRQQLADHLRIDSQLIRMTKLRAKPIYKETISKPGETTTIYPEGSGKIGAFVHVAGRGNHAIMSGHGRSPGDVLLHRNGSQIGVVKVASHPPWKPSSDYSCCGYIDVALAKLDKQDGYIGQVFCDDHGPLHLVEQPSEAVEGMKVRCFAGNGNRGRVDSMAYIRHDEALKTDWRFTSVMNDEGGPIHDEGESGIFIVHDAPDKGSVKAVGMLVGIDELPLDDEYGTTRRTSLAVPLPTSFKVLQKADYCKEREIKFIH